MRYPVVIVHVKQFVLKKDFPSLKGGKLTLWTQLIKPKFFVCLSVYLSIWRSVYRPVYPYVCMLHVCLCVCLFLCPFVCSSASHYVCLSDGLTVFLSVCLPVCLPVCLSVCLLAYLPVYLQQRHLSLIMYDSVNWNVTSCLSDLLLIAYEKSKLKNTEYNAAMDHIPKIKYYKGSFSYIQ